MITRTAKLDYKMNYLVVRSGENIQRINIDEIALLLIETPSVSLTAYLLCELSAHKVNVIFCDDKRSPDGMYVPFYGSHDTSRKVRLQMHWADEARENIWAAVVRQKILGQAAVLEESKHADTSAMLKKYASDVVCGDTTNREGFAAKVYFNSLFGKNFTRQDKEDPVNGQLNYGYAILLSTVCREIVSQGYITQIGIHHENVFNEYNLACDLMEPFRPFIDCLVLKMKHDELKKEDKKALVGFLNRQIIFDGKMQFISNAIPLYVKSVLEAIDKNLPALIKFPDYELSVYESDSVL